MKSFSIFTAVFFSLLLCAAPLKIFLPAKPTATESSAASELAEYLQKITGTKPQILTETAGKSAGAIYVGNTAFAGKNGVDTAQLASEEWLLQSRGDDLIIAGGKPRGILFAVYHYLEDCLGVRFWTFKEDTVPARKDIPLKNISRRGKPEFLARELCSLHLKDSGRFAAKMRITSTRGNYYGQIDPKEKRSFGMENIFGPGNRPAFLRLSQYHRTARRHRCPRQCLYYSV